MTITYEEAKEIAKGLPIGYYLGRKVQVEIDPSGGANADVVKGVIHIGMNILADAASKVTKEMEAKWDRETILRCVLYHEIGHLLLTPPWLGFIDVDVDGLTFTTMQAITNIFEDERLERVLESFFMGVDFHGFIQMLSAPGGDTKEAKVFDAVRLRIPPELSRDVDDAIAKTALIHARTGSLDRLPSSRTFAKVTYRNELSALVKKILEHKPEENPSDSDSKPEENPSEGGESKDDPNPDEDKSKPESDGEVDDGEPDKGATPAKLAMPCDFLEHVAGEVFYTPPTDVQNTLNRLAVRLSKKKGSQAAGCWSGLHGRISTKRDAMDKERFFRRQSDVGDRINTSVHMTVWVDVSGSFINSKEQLNQILVALNKSVEMSGGRLTADVVKMDTQAKLAPPAEWEVDPDGGNAIERSYYDCWLRTRKKDRRNIDVVVFDGYAKSDQYWAVHENRGCDEVNGVPVEQVIWNHPDCHIVTDTSNDGIFSPLKKAHVKYIGGNYASQLQAELIKVLDRIM